MAAGAGGGRATEGPDRSRALGTGHEPTRMDSIELWVELGEWEQALKRAGYYRWPLTALQEESCHPRARDEHAWMRAFARRSELP
jgi:hypothetical protein